MERRLIDAQMEVRAADGEPLRMVGYAAVFNQWSEDLGGFRERIAPGAFKRTLEGDVRALWNHDPSFVLGRTLNGTLKLEEDARGLRVEIAPPVGGIYDGFVDNVRRGDVNQMSFAFSVVKDDRQRDEKGNQVRILQEVRLHEVSPVSFPAYPTTEVGLREWRYMEVSDDESNGQAPAEIEREAVLRAQAEQRTRMQMQAKILEVDDGRY